MPLKHIVAKASLHSFCGHFLTTRVSDHHYRQIGKLCSMLLENCQAIGPLQSIIYKHCIEVILSHYLFKVCLSTYSYKCSTTEFVLQFPYNQLPIIWAIINDQKTHGAPQLLYSVQSRIYFPFQELMPILLVPP